MISQTRGMRDCLERRLPASVGRGRVKTNVTVVRFRSNPEHLHWLHSEAPPNAQTDICSTGIDILNIEFP